MSNPVLHDNDAVDLAGIEALAVELAGLAGREIAAAFGTIFTATSAIDHELRTTNRRLRMNFS